ncbi:hypothetical protein VRU48_00055 [Pedobacter sp. KR3-3]|uniref:CCDC81-like prokaryotic HU domain-containing protein n=1 Tax=Pedobacter albus TaxID=3113905 RepID=A0ABU7I283_9SPHI|nr:hypothetical protein [Pedobacter sp. KR3-3]MEE1943476.1 hypothetical protein [Pedobacter sp. KR3-3]
MDILLYLTELLQTRKTVGIVGLGTLYKKKTPGKYDAAQHAFIPPSYALAFTTELKEQEELAGFISQRRNISIESSNYFIGEFAEQIQAKLHDHQEADLEPIGKLKLVNGEIVFEPEAESSFGFEFYGLPTLSDLKQQDTHAEEPVQDEDLAEIEEENRLEEENPGDGTTDHPVAPIETEEVTVDDNEVEAEVPVQENTVEAESDEQSIHEEIAEVTPTASIQEAEQTTETVREPVTVYEAPKIETVETADQPAEEQAPVAQHTEVYTEEEEPKKSMPFFIKILIILLVIVALGAIAYFINPAFFNKYLKKNFEGTHDQNVPSAPLDTLKNQANTTKADSLAKNNALVTLSKDSTAIDSNVMVYEVLVASVKTDKVADKIIANLATRKITGKKVRLSKTRINISAGTFTKPELAKKYEDSLQKVLKDPGIYTQSIKLKNEKQ